jgi:uncharacterized protein
MRTKETDDVGAEHRGVALTEVTVDNEKGYDADVFDLRDGKTVRVQVHTDTAMMERVYGKKELAVA